MFTYGFDSWKPLTSFDELRLYEDIFLPGIRVKYKVTETDSHVTVLQFGAKLPKDAYYFRRFHAVEQDPDDVAADPHLRTNLNLLLGEEKCSDFVFISELFYAAVFPVEHEMNKKDKVKVKPKKKDPNRTGQSFTDDQVAETEKAYSDKQSHCAALAVKQWTQPPIGTRHCGFCLVEIPPDVIKSCGGCNKRAYCSKECQVVDWKSDGGGQNHKYWCKVGCCEEDIDWEVVPISGKGLGIIAKSFIPMHTRIIVEPDSQTSHPRIIDLKPIKGTICRKLYLNAIDTLSTKNNPHGYGLGIRTARLNHSCDYNAASLFDPDLNAIIVYSCRDIQPGQEITISYKGSIFNELTLKGIDKLKRRGISCSADCTCKNPDRIKQIEELVKLGEFLQKRKLKTLDFPVIKVNRYLELHETLGCNQLDKCKAFTLATNLVLSSNDRRDSDSRLRLYKAKAKLLESITGSKGSIVQQIKALNLDLDCPNSKNLHSPLDDLD